MTISPDNIILGSWGFFNLNATLLYTWLIMALLTLASWLIGRRLSSGTGMSHWQNLLEVIVSGTRDQIREVSRQDYSRYLPFIGTLFLFILTSNLLAIVPGYIPPTGSLSTTTALAICVLVAVPLYGIAHEGLLNYLRHYIKPTPLMLPFNLIGELSRTVALAVPLRQHHERHRDRRHPAQPDAFFLPRRHAAAGADHRHHPGLHFRHPGHGVHRLGQRGASAHRRKAGSTHAKRRPPWITFQSSA